MFNTAQIEYIETLVPAMQRQGYDYYLAVTNTNINSYNTQVPVDLYIYFSKEPITPITLYRYQLPECIRYSIRSVNYSTSSYGVNTERVVTETLSARTLSINAYEHVSTNAKSETATVVQPDYLWKGYKNYETNASSTIIISALLFFLGFLTMFRR